MSETLTMKLLLSLVICHLIGDYVLQSDFLAKTKGDNWYHLFVHCALYCLPFMFMFGITWRLLCIFSVHFVVDALKARYKKINYTTDQIAHYLALLIYLC